MTDVIKFHRSGRTRAFRFGVTLAVLVGCALGCSTTRTTYVGPSPLNTEQQQQAVLELVPLGTSRAEAEERLKHAGIEFTVGQSNSIYYCDVWNRDGGERWHLDVALLFDKSGNLYATRAAETQIALDGRSIPAEVDRPGKGATPALNAAGRD